MRELHGDRAASRQARFTYETRPREWTCTSSMPRIMNSSVAKSALSSSEKLPLSPGTFPTLWNNDQGFLDSYLTDFPGYYKTADAGYMDDDGYVFVMSRTDDIINVAGHRLSTGGIEEVFLRTPTSPNAPSSESTTS